MSAVVVLGKDGLVGAWVVTAARAAGLDVLALGRGDIDLSAPGAVDDVRKRAEAAHAAAIVVAASLPSVEGCERDPEGTARVNVALPAALARALSSSTRLIAFSSEYVFDGKKGAPYVETDAPAPINAYGRQKLALEEALLPRGHIVLRTSAVYDVERARKNFVYQLMDAAKAGKQLRVADDQIVTPTLARDLAGFVVELVRTRAGGAVLHAAGPRVVERVAFAREVARAFGVDDGVIAPVPTASMGLLAPRPRAGLATRAPGFHAPAEGLAAMRATMGAA